MKSMWFHWRAVGLRFAKVRPRACIRRGLTIFTGRSIRLLRVTFAMASTTLTVTSTHADVLIWNSPIPEDNYTWQLAWLDAIGVSTPEYIEEFETPRFTLGENISGRQLTYLVIRDTGESGVPEARIDNTITGSDPIGTFAVWHDSQPYLELDFCSRPVDYVAFFDIDQAGMDCANEKCLVTLCDGSVVCFTLDGTTSVGYSAEFVGIFRNDRPRIVKIQLDASGADGGWGIDNIYYGRVNDTVEPCVGPCPPVAIEGTTWGKVKAIYSAH